MSENFPEIKSLEGKVKVELDLSNYATKTDLKKESGVDTSKFSKKLDLANVKSNVDELDIDKLKNVPTNFTYLVWLISSSLGQCCLSIAVALFLGWIQY